MYIANAEKNVWKTMINYYIRHKSQYLQEIHLREVC